ncbi:hypothetical protein LCGC14_2399580 [marine sediment metagenome]|uniref:Uncharacterized protein n=1 Tax=marine sediment metagenome TaxID=412755 RepID=A0A0F9BVU6_9ZZZZ
MSEPTSALSFEDLVKRVAELLEIADWDTSDGTLVVPVTDKYSLEQCIRYVNNGIRMFIADAPPKGWRWMERIHSLTMAITYTGTATGGGATTLVDSGIADTYADDFFNTYTIYITEGTGVGESATVSDYTGASGTFTFSALSGGSTPDTTTKYTIAKSADAINGDGGRYMLPENFGGSVDGKITYAADSNHGTQINWVHEARIRDFRSIAIQSGYPVWAATLPYSPTGSAISANRRWEIMFEPRPASIQTVMFPYTLHFNKLQMRGGTATSAGATTIADTSRHEPDDYFNGQVVKVIHGTGKFSYAVVTDYVGSTGAFTVADWLDEDGGAGGTDPATGSLYIVQPAANIHPAGLQFDNTIEAACKARAQMETGDAGDNWIQEYRQVALPEAHRLDARSIPRRLGKFTSGYEGIGQYHGWRRRRCRSYDDVTTDNDL